MSSDVSAVLIEGDGIGPEIAEAVVMILDKAKAGVEWERMPAGYTALLEHGSTLPDRTLTAIREKRLALKGPLTTPVAGSIEVGSDFKSVNVQLRRTLDLYANYRPVRTVPGVKTRFSDIDLVFIRENTEGLYSGLEHEITDGVVTSLKVATRKACTRIAEFAFDFARREKRKKVTGVHKANIMKLSDGLALECYRAVSKKFPEIEYDEKIIDATAMALVMNPEKFDVLVMENLYGDILSDLGAGLVGGLGLAASGNFGALGAVFEAVHGSAPDIAGKGIANPTALLLSAVELLRFCGKGEVAQRISDATLEVYREGKTLTRDIGGNASTMTFANAIAERV